MSTYLTDVIVGDGGMKFSFSVLSLRKIIKYRLQILFKENI